MGAVTKNRWLLGARFSPAHPLRIRNIGPFRCMWRREEMQYLVRPKRDSQPNNTHMYYCITLRIWYYFEILAYVHMGEIQRQTQYRHIIYNVLPTRWARTMLCHMQCWWGFDSVMTPVGVEGGLLIGVVSSRGQAGEIVRQEESVQWFCSVFRRIYGPLKWWFGSSTHSIRCSSSSSSSSTTP